MADWLDEARGCLERGEHKQAVDLLDHGAYLTATPETYQAAAALADDLALRLQGRQRRRAARVAAAHRSNLSRYTYTVTESEDDVRRARLVPEVLMFMLLAAFAETDDPSLFDAAGWWIWADSRVWTWARELLVPYNVGYSAVTDLGSFVLSPAEAVELRQILTEVINETVVAHLELIDDIAALRAAVPAVFGLALATDDVRAKEVLSRLQRHAGSRIGLPNDTALSTLFLDAMQAAAPTREERAFFSAAASASFNVGIGAAVHDRLQETTSGTPS